MIKKSKYAIYYVEPDSLKNDDQDSINDICKYDSEYRMSKSLFDELAPYYDKNSQEFSITKQSEIYLNNPLHDLYMRKKFNLPLPMEYRN